MGQICIMLDQICIMLGQICMLLAVTILPNFSGLHARERPPAIRLAAPPYEA